MRDADRHFTTLPQVKAPKEASKPITGGTSVKNTKEGSGQDSRLGASASVSSFSSASSLKASGDLDGGSSYQPSFASGRGGKAEAVSSSGVAKKASPFPWDADTADDDQVTNVTPATPSAVSAGGYEPSFNKRPQGGLSTSTSTSSTGYQPSFARQPVPSAIPTPTTQAPSSSATEVTPMGSGGGGGYEPSLFGAKGGRDRAQNTRSAGGYEPSFGRSEASSQGSLSNSASSAALDDGKGAPASSSGYESNLFGRKPAAPSSTSSGYEPSFARSAAPHPPTPSTPTSAYEPNLFGKKSSAYPQPSPAPPQPSSAATGGYEPSFARPTVPVASNDVAPAPSGGYEPSLFGGKKKEVPAPVSGPSAGYEPSLFGPKRPAAPSSTTQPTPQPAPQPTAQQPSAYEPSLFGGKKSAGAEGSGAGKGGGGTQEPATGAGAGGYEPNVFGSKKTAGSVAPGSGSGASSGGTGGYEPSVFGSKKPTTGGGGDMGAKGQGSAEPSLFGARKEPVASGAVEGEGAMTATARARADKVVVYAPQHHYMLQDAGSHADAVRRLWEGLGEEERGELEMLEGRNAALQAQVRACRERLRHALGQR